MASIGRLAQRIVNHSDTASVLDAICEITTRGSDLIGSPGSLQARDKGLLTCLDTFEDLKAFTKTHALVFFSRSFGNQVAPNPWPPLIGLYILTYPTESISISAGRAHSIGFM